MKFPLLITFILVLFLSACKESPVELPPQPQEEDFSYPQSSRFAVSLITDNTIVANASNFDVKVVFYNVQDVFGTAIELLYDKNLISIQNDSKILLGPFFNFKDSSKVLLFKKLENELGRINAAISYIRNSNLVSNGSGVIIKLKFTTVNRGNAVIKINKNKFEIRKNDGSYINNFSNLEVDSLKITIY